MNEGKRRQISRRTGIHTAQMEEELGMMDIDTGRYYLLDDIGSAIWNLLEVPMTTEQLVGKLVVLYEVSPEVCLTDVERFIQTLLDKKMIEIGLEEKFI